LFAPIDVELPDAAELLNHFLAEEAARG